MSTTVTSFIPERVANTALTRKADSLVFPFSGAPQAMTVYCRFRERGNAALTIVPRVWSCGTGSFPGLNVSFPSGGAGYQLTFNNNISGSSTIVTLATKPAVGQLVELRATLTSGGVIQLGQSINGATETLTASGAAMVLPQAWNTAQFFAGGIGGHYGAIAIQNLLVMRGVQTLATMRKYAGV